MSESERQPEAPTVLVCTVGGSDAPIRTALRRMRPDVVWFLVSDGKQGKSSRPIVEGDDGLGRAEGCPTACVVKEVPADDPDRTLALCRSYFVEIKRRHPTARIIADYTGGTKSMTGGLLMAAFAEPGIAVQFMRGSRPDLDRVEDGTEEPVAMPADFVTADRTFRTAAQAVEEQDYAAAERILKKLSLALARSRYRPPQGWSKRLEIAKQWCGVMADWDAFRHTRAWRAAEAAWDGGAPLGEALAATGHLEPLRRLATEREGPGWTVCADLWLNAQRRAGRGRFDDAVARLYRLVEAVAQTQLRQRYRLESEAIPWDALPDEMKRAERHAYTPQGRKVARLGLNRLIEFLRSRDPDDPVAARYLSQARDGKLEGPSWLGSRNRSILAHGFTTVTEQDWEIAEGWVRQNFAEFWKEAQFPQLPNVPPPTA
jgi:CRISPR-associated protein (TIGR02710 family)